MTFLCSGRLGVHSAKPTRHEKHTYKNAQGQTELFKRRSFWS